MEVARFYESLRFFEICFDWPYLACVHPRLEEISFVMSKKIGHFALGFSLVEFFNSSLTLADQMSYYVLLFSHSFDTAERKKLLDY